MLAVYHIFFTFNEAEPLFANDNLDSVEKTLINKVMVIEDYMVLEQIRKLVFRIFIAYHVKRMITTLRPKLLNFVLDKTYEAFPAFLLKFKYLNEICDFL